MKVLLPDAVMPITAILIFSVGVDQYRNPHALPEQALAIANLGSVYLMMIRLSAGRDRLLGRIAAAVWEPIATNRLSWYLKCHLGGSCRFEIVILISYMVKKLCDRCIALNIDQDFLCDDERPGRPS